MKFRSLLYLCAGLFAASAPAGAAEPAGAAVFQERCARCHQVERLQGYMARRPDDATRMRDLDAFLARHHARDATERKALVAWLVSQHKPAP